MKASELDGRHLGYQVRVADEHAEFMGTLLAVEHKADLIEEAPLGSSGFLYPPALGRKSVVITIAGGTLHVSPTAEVEVRVS